MQQIPDNILKKFRGIIPNSVAEPALKDDPESQPFQISYYYYNDKLCELEDIQKNGSKKILKDFRIIGSSTNIVQFKRYNIDSTPIKKTSEYIKLYSGLPPDAELKENSIQGTSRFFYFIVDRVFFIVTIRNRHFETKKVRR